MIVLTPELMIYKERTLERLLHNRSLLEKQLGQETRPEVIDSIQKQLGEIREHAARVEQELAEGIMTEPVADEMAQRIARALVKEKMHMARRYLGKLETIEPFHPELARLQSEAEAGRVSRRTRSLAENGVTYPDAPVAVSGEVLFPGDRAERYYYDEPEQEGWWQYLFQFHIMVSCMVVLLILCSVGGVASFLILQYLFEGA